MAGNSLLREARGYVIASATAFALDFALLALLVSVLRVPYMPAAAVSFIAGTLFVYWASVRHVFAFRSVGDHRIEVVVFTAIGFIGLLANLAVMYVAVGGLGLHYLVGKCVAASVTVGLNFALRRRVLFSPRRQTTFGRELPR